MDFNHKTLPQIIVNNKNVVANTNDVTNYT